MRWDLPLRLLGSLHYLALTEGIDPWADVRTVLEQRREWIRRFVAEQGVQTNEVGRCFGLLPCFLSLGNRTLDLVELGPSAGLNLLWDRYGYAYSAGEWGPRDATFCLEGEERSPVPAELLRRRPEVLRRRGIDLEPIDVTTEEDALILEAFVWADQTERLERLRCAIQVARDEPPELIGGDYVELLPQLLTEREEGVLTVVFQTASLGYLSDERREQLFSEIWRAGGEGPLAFLTGTFDPEMEGCWPLELTVWPGGETRRLAYQDFHGAWLDWMA